MSHHKQEDFSGIPKFAMDMGLASHGLESDKPSQLSDAFRAGAAWAHQRAQQSGGLQIVPPAAQNWPVPIYDGMVRCKTEVS